MQNILLTWSFGEPMFIELALIFLSILLFGGYFLYFMGLFVFSSEILEHKKQGKGNLGNSIGVGAASISFICGVLACLWFANQEIPASDYSQYKKDKLYITEQQKKTGSAEPAINKITSEFERDGKISRSEFNKLNSMAMKTQYSEQTKEHEQNLLKQQAEGLSIQKQINSQSFKISE